MKEYNFTHIFLFIAVAAALPSCMQEEAFEAPESTESICFSAKMISGSGVTKSTVDCLELEDETWLVEASDIPGSTKAAPVTAMSGSVGITAIEYSGTWDEANAYPNTRMKNDEFTYDGGILTPVTPRAWRNIANDDKIRFFAYSPYLTNSTGLSAMDGTDKGTPYVDYAVNATASNQTDLLFANSASNTTEDYTKDFRSTVPLEFKHALTAVQFKVGFDCTVTSLKLCNIVDKGRFQATTSGSWTYPTASKTDFSLSFGTDDAGVAKTSGQFIVDEDSTFMMIPQSFAAVTAFDAASDAYLELRYTKTDTNSQVTSHTLRAPLGGASGSSWPMGHKLVYTIYEEAVPEVEYIYMDLAAGSVSITNTSYSGNIYRNGTSETVSGTHSSTNKYYIYQSTGTTGTNGTDQTGYVSTKAGESIVLPSYGEMYVGSIAWPDYITDRSSFSEVHDAWPTALTAAGRTSTNNVIDVGNKVVNCDITLDNIYSYTNMGIDFCPSGDGQSLTLRLKGNNRFGRIRYISYYKSTLCITSAKGDGMVEGSLTCGAFSSNGNHFHSAIGADNINHNAEDIVINGGTIYAGTFYDENCTAIGAGGNGTGVVRINGGRVTAVAATTGAAIGGGIGVSDPGGDADVTISGGYVYAYNHHNECSIPAAAIGGGSSSSSAGNKSTKVTISGGYVYAQCAAGVAIGGGSSASKYGGPATVNISGGTIVAKSIADGSRPAGAGIGGGTGGSGGNGGSVTMNISGNPVITTGSIGGGKTTGSGYKIGSATISITGNPVINGQFVMAAGSSGVPSFTMEGGTIKSSSTSDTEFVKINNNGGAVYIEDGTCTISAGTISGCRAAKGGAIYMQKSGTKNPEFKMTGGTITGNTSTSDGGAVYVADGTVTMTGGTISNNLTIDGNGGGVCVQGGSFTMNGPESSTMIINNAAHHDTSRGGYGGDGGGIYISSTTSDPDVKIIQGTVTGNAADNSGGGIGVNMSEGSHTATIVIGDNGDNGTGSKISPYVAANSAALSGGGMYVEGSGSNVYIWSGTTKGNVSAYVTNEDIRNDGGLIYLSNDAVTADKVDVQHVTITFHANNGSDPETTAVQHVVTSTNSLLTPPAEAKAFTKNYNTFKGWNTKRDGTGTHYEIDGYTSGTTTQATMNLSSDLSLFAEWQLN